MIDAPLLVWKLHAGQHSWSTHLRIHKAAREKFIKMMYVAKSLSQATAAATANQVHKADQLLSCGAEKPELTP